MTVYVITLEGEPQVVYKDIDQVRQECYKWYQIHQTNFDIERDFNWWIEGRNEYTRLDSEEAYERAWNDYVEEQFNNGTWGDYAWYECYLK